jgi:hypothetical protein
MVITSMVPKVQTVIRSIGLRAAAAGVAMPDVQDGAHIVPFVVGTVLTGGSMILNYRNKITSLEATVNNMKAAYEAAQKASETAAAAAKTSAETAAAAAKTSADTAAAANIELRRTLLDDVANRAEEFAAKAVEAKVLAVEAKVSAVEAKVQADVKEVKAHLDVAETKARLAAENGALKVLQTYKVNVVQNDPRVRESFAASDSKTA